MKLKYPFIFFIAMAITSCKWGVPSNPKSGIVKDTLSYSYKHLKERAADCGNKPDSTCTSVDLTYPIFKGQQTLNDSVKNRVTSTFKIDEKLDISVTGLVKHFFDLYKKDTSPNNTSGMAYKLNIAINVLRQDSSITTLGLNGYSYLGGAHGGSVISFINWNNKLNKEIVLNDILSDGYREKLTQVAEKIFRKDEKLTDTASLTPNYFFKDGKFTLNSNYSITPLGIRFLYNEYEIKPYSSGTTNLFIPYQQIKSLLRPNTVVTQYIK